MRTVHKGHLPGRGMLAMNWICQWAECINKWAWWDRRSKRMEHWHAKRHTLVHRLRCSVRMASLVRRCSPETRSNPSVSCNFDWKWDPSGDRTWSVGLIQFQAFDLRARKEVSTSRDLRRKQLPGKERLALAAIRFWLKSGQQINGHSSPLKFNKPEWYLCSG